MIVATDTRRPAPRWLRAATWMATLCALPFGLVYCDRPTPEERGEEETASEAPALESPVETFEDELADILTRREEQIHQSIQERVESGELDEYRGMVLSAYVSGAKAGLLGHYEGRRLSRDEKKAAAEALRASANWDGLERAAAFDMLLMDMLLTERIAQLMAEVEENEAELARKLREHRLLVSKRPELPILIKRQPKERKRQSHAL